MKKFRLCVWCGAPFIANKRHKAQKYCCHQCSSYAATENIRFQDAMEDRDDTLGYYKFIIRKIIRGKDSLWKSLVPVQWEHLIRIHDGLSLPLVPTDLELEKVDAEITKILGMPALQPTSESMKKELRLYCKPRRPRPVDEM